MEKKDSFLKPFKRNQQEDPGLTEQAINDQKELTDIIRHMDKETPDLLASIDGMLSSGVNALASDYNLCLYDNLGDVCPPLHVAAVRGLPKLTELLLKNKGHPNVADSVGVTAAHVAADAGSAECLKILIEYGADISATTKRSTVNSWNSKRDLGVFKVLGLWARFQLCCEENTTPLHLAAQGNHLECVRLLLDHGANINAMDSRQQSPLYLAARGGHPECMMMLLQNSSSCPDVFTPTDTQDTALIQCFRHDEKMRDCIKELVYRGADVSHHNRHGISAIHKAVYNNWDMDMMNLLVLEGRGMDFDRIKGGSPLMTLMDRQLRHYRDGKEASLDDSTAILFLRMGATRKELRALLWCELNLPKQAGVLLETLIKSFGHLPSLSELEAERASKSLFSEYLTAPDGFAARWVCSGPLWHRLEEQVTEEARRQKEESLKAIVAQKKRHYQQRCAEVPSLLHLSCAAIRSKLQADVRKVISWPVPPCYKWNILLGHDL